MGTDSAPVRLKSQNRGRYARTEANRRPGTSESRATTVKKISYLRSVFVCLQHPLRRLNLLVIMMPSSAYHQESLSLVHGSTTAPLWYNTIADLIREREQEQGDSTAVIVPWQQARLSYRELAKKSEDVSKALIAAGLRKGDFVAIMAGNRHEYIEVFLGAGRIGCPAVVVNNTFTEPELLSALARTCKPSTSPFKGAH